MNLQVMERVGFFNDHPRVIRGFQIRLARTMLNWTQQQLADRARLGIATVQRAEQADMPPLTVSNLFAIQRALEDGGVIFIDDGEQSLSGGPGIRRRS
jgi:transcriptional regulator with XRE-family HTH domain